MTRALWLFVALTMSTLPLAACEAEGDDDAPLITTDRVRPHVDRGHCAACHVVAPRAGAGVRAAPLITAHQVRPHPDRGDCTGCHAVARP